MNYFAIDIFSDEIVAKTTAEALRQSGRKNVVIKQKDSILVNDCRSEPHKAIVDIGTAPIFIILSEK